MLSYNYLWQIQIIKRATNLGRCYNKTQEHQTGTIMSLLAYLPIPPTVYGNFFSCSLIELGIFMNMLRKMREIETKSWFAKGGRSALLEGSNFSRFQCSTCLGSISDYGRTEVDGKGASINDVHENFEFFDPLPPPLSHTWSRNLSVLLSTFRLPPSPPGNFAVISITKCSYFAF